MLSDLATRLRSLFRRQAVEAELDDELRFHLEQQSEKYIRAGMSAEEARRQARLDFGGLTQVQEECRQARGITFLETLAQDLRFALRMLRKSPGFTTVVVLSLALGIGTNTAIFSFINAVMLRSLPVGDPQQLVIPQWSARNTPRDLHTSSFGDCDTVEKRTNPTGCSFSYPVFEQLRSRTDLFTGVAAFSGPAHLNLSGNGETTVASTEFISGDYFQTLEVPATLGRLLGPADDKPGAPAVAVLDYGYWQRAFGGSPAVIGRTIRLNNAVFTIIGVASPTFTRLAPGKSIDLYVGLDQTKVLGHAWEEPSNPRTFV